MAATKSNRLGPDDNQPRRPDPYVGLHFWVQIDNINVAGFSECSPPTVETEVFEYVEGGLNTYTHKLPVRIKYGNITLKRGIDENRDLFSWYAECLQGKHTRKNVSIILYDSEMREVRKYDLFRAFPVKWTGPDMKTDSGAITVETLELAHEGFADKDGKPHLPLTPFTS